MDFLTGLMQGIYRHGQKIEVAEAPAIDFTVLEISQGDSYLRFLLQFD